MAVGFLTMVPARASGVIHTVDPAAPQRDVMVVSATPGLGPSVVQGTSPVDRFELSREPCPRVLSRSIADKELRLVARDGGGIEQVPLAASARTVAVRRRTTSWSSWRRWRCGSSGTPGSTRRSSGRWTRPARS